MQQPRDKIWWSALSHDLQAENASSPKSSSFVQAPGPEQICSFSRCYDLSLLRRGQ